MVVPLYALLTISNLAQYVALQDFLILNIEEILTSLSEEFHFVTILIPVEKFRESTAHQATDSGVALHTKLQIQGYYCTPGYSFWDRTAHQATDSVVTLHTKLQIQG